MRDIENKEDIEVFVDQFYNAVRKDETIGPIFNNQIEDHMWPRHLERMYSFWNTVLFGQRDYRGNPFAKHRDLPINEEHFNSWLSLLCDIIDSNFKGVKAEEVKLRGEKMSIMFQSKLAYLAEHKNFRSII